MARDGGAQRKRRGERVPTATEQQLWDQMTRDVTPLTRSRDRSPVDVPDLESVSGMASAAETTVAPVALARTSASSMPPSSVSVPLGQT